MAGLSPATGGITDGRASITLASSSQSGDEKEPSLITPRFAEDWQTPAIKLKAPTGYLFGYRSGLSSTLSQEVRLRTCLPSCPVSAITGCNYINVETAVKLSMHRNNGRAEYNLAPLLGRRLIVPGLCKLVIGHMQFLVEVVTSHCNCKTKLLVSLTSRESNTALRNESIKSFSNE
jgi:hypothetical protein